MARRKRSKIGAGLRDERNEKKGALNRRNEVGQILTKGLLGHGVGEEVEENRERAGREKRKKSPLFCLSKKKKKTKGGRCIVQEGRPNGVA